MSDTPETPKSNKDDSQDNVPKKPLFSRANDREKEDANKAKDSTPPAKPEPPAKKPEPPKPETPKPESKTPDTPLKSETPKPTGATGPVPKTPAKPGGATGPVPKTPAKPSGATGPVPKTPAAASPRAAAAKAAAARPATAGKPAPAARPAPVSKARRHFLFTWLGLAWTGFALATGAALTTCLRFLYPNVLFEPKMSFKIGRPDEYEIGKVDTRWKDQFGVWIIRNFEGMYALSTVCTHLGCPPSWLESEQKFKCPCHGSGFYKTGINFEGPAPRPLERYRIGLADDGQVQVDKSKKFQQEKGEWENTESFLVV